MDKLADLIDRLESEPYYFVGSFWSASSSESSPRPFEFDCQFHRDHTAVIVSGIYRAHTGAPQHPFALKLPFKGVTPRGAYADLSIPTFGSLGGTLFFVAGVGTFLVRSKETILSGHLTLDDRGVISLVGTFEHLGRFHGYALKGAVASYRASLSNVVGIGAPRRA